MKLFLFLFILQIVVTSCATKQKETQNNPDLLIIDLDNIKNKETAKASDFFKNSKSIILETNENSLIGNIKQIYINNHDIIVFDDSENLSVLVFNLDGTFSHKIGELGRGESEKVSLKYRKIYKLHSNQRQKGKYAYSVSGQLFICRCQYKIG